MNAQESRNTVLGRRRDGPLRIAFCGCGNIARAHARAFAPLPGVTLHAFWDWNPDLATRFHADHEGAYCTDDFRRIARDPDVDAVYINTLHCDRLRLVEAMAAAGKPVFCEKPLAHTPQALRQMYACLQRHDVLFWSGYKIRFHTLVQRAREWLPAPEVISAAVHDDIWPDGPLNDPDLGGGNTLSQGVYAAETARMLAGSLPVAVSAFARHARHPAGTADTLCATYEFANGAIAAITTADAGCCAGPVGKFSALAAGGNRSVVLAERFSRLACRDGQTGEEKTLTHEEDGFRRQSEAFFRAVRGTGKNRCDFIEGAIPSIMIHRALAAAESGRREPIDVLAFLGNV